jgi:hypothetical protein
MPSQVLVEPAAPEGADQGVDPLADAGPREPEPAMYLDRFGIAENDISLPRPGRSRAWLKVALAECHCWH